jgi:APA family basic amino acid/polyamine antiporter
MMLGQSRIYYAIASDGLLPGVLARVHQKSGVPRNATVLASIATGVIAGLLPLTVLGELVSIGTLLAFSIVCISIIVLRKTQPALKRPFKVPLVPFVPLLGVAICLLQMLSLPWNTWLRLIIWTVVGIILYFSYGFWHSRLREKT